MDDASTPLSVLATELAAFNAERDWGRFHTPRDLAMALSVEAGELLELFLWKRDAAELPAADALGDELADVLICLVNLASRTGIDLMAAAAGKLAKNARKYPVDKARGNAKKWTEHAREGGGDGEG